MEKGNDFDLRLEDCKGNVFVQAPSLRAGRYRRVSLARDGAIDLERCRGNTFIDQGEEEPSPPQTFP